MAANTAPRSAHLPPLAYGLDELPFGRVKAYEEINAGRLAATKLGRRTLILATELQRYLESLPAATPETMCDLAANRRKRKAAPAEGAAL